MIERDYLLNPRPTAPTGLPLHAIAIDVCNKHDLTLAQLQGPQRSRYVAQARWEFMHRAYRETGASTPGIGLFLNRDHTTVLYGIRKHEQLMRDGLSPSTCTA